MKPMENDADLLQQYVRDRSEPAFRELVDRHIGLVNATALRVLAGDSHAAQDVTQLVFTDLARKAAKLPPGVLLGGWLHQHTYFLACNIVRTETRRRTRERTAMELNDINQDAAQEAHWLHLAPVLDEALNCLGDEDRNAIVLRYFQQQDVRTIGEALGTTESAAQKRLGRALEKLRALITRRGVALASAATLATTLEASPIAVTVPGLATAIATHALAATAATAAVTSTLTLASLKTMITSKLALSLAAAAAFGAVTTVLVTQNKPVASPAPVSAPAPAANKNPVPIVVQSTPSQVAAPKVAPVAAHDADPSAQVAPAAPDSAALANAEQMLREKLAAEQGQLTSGQGVLVFSASSSDPGSGSGQPTVVTGGTMTILQPAAATVGNAYRQGSNGTFIQVAGSSGVITSPSQISDNGDGTMTITLTDGSTKIVPKPTMTSNSMSVVKNADGSFTKTVTNGDTKTVTIVQPGEDSGGGVTGGTLILNSSP